MTLPDLVDLEAQLARDRDADPAALEARDRALAPHPAPPRRDALLGGWLAALRAAEPGRLFPGAATENALRATRLLLTALGLALGWGAAAVVLGYTGAHPVNVWDFLLAFVGVQLLLVALLLATFFLPLAASARPLVGLVRGGVAALYGRLARRTLDPDRAAAWATLWHRLRGRRSLYQRLEPWLLLGLTQRFGVAFNVGALLACLRLFAFSDVAFGWGTTLVELDAGRFHGMVEALALPWRGLWPDAVPSRALVEATRYSRLESAYLGAGAGRAARPELVGGWWPFLVAALACYGLFPRVLLLAVSRLRSARLLARLPLDDAEVSRLVRRLAEPRLETRAAAEEPPLAPRGDPGAGDAAPPAAGARCAVVLWRDAPGGAALEAAVARHARAAVAAVHAAGGRDHEEGARDWREVVDGVEPVVVVAEGFEAPDRAAVRFLAELRAAVGPRRPLLVLLAGEPAAGAPRPASPGEVRLWREGLARLADPHLAVLPLGEAS
jgi:hypothetical protein